MRNRYLARSRPGSVPHERVWARRAARTALSASAGVRLGDEGQRLFRGRVDRGERAAALGRDVAAADEQPVALLDRDDVARFGCRRVLPRDRLAVAQAPARRRAAVRRDEAGGRVGGHARHYVTRSGRCFPHARAGIRTSLAVTTVGTTCRDLPYPPNMRIRVLLAGLLLAGVLAGCGVLGKAAPSPVATGPWTTVAAAPVELTEVAVAATTAGSGSPAACAPTGPRASPSSCSTRRPARGRPARRSPRRSTMRRSSRRRPGSSSSAATSATP